MSYGTPNDSNRRLTDQNGRVWHAERVGRTSGIISTRKSASLPPPSDIIRFVCESDESESVRETTIRAGSLGEMPEEELIEILFSARTINKRR